MSKDAFHHIENLMENIPYAATPFIDNNCSENSIASELETEKHNINSLKPSEALLPTIDDLLSKLRNLRSAEDNHILESNEQISDINTLNRILPSLESADFTSPNSTSSPSTQSSLGAYSIAFSLGENLNENIHHNGVNDMKEDTMIGNEIGKFAL